MNFNSIITDSKIRCAEKTLEFINNDSIIGLGTGSTVEIFIELLAKNLYKFSNLIFTSTSNRTTEFAKRSGIEIIPFEKIDYVDLTIDGADEVDMNLNGIKGGGGALLFEKIVAKNSKRNIWIVDSSKIVNKLGTFPLPVEIVPFALNSLLRVFNEMSLNPKQRFFNDKPFITDSSNFIIDCKIGEIDDPIDLETRLKLLTGVVEVGLFNNIVDIVIIGYPDESRIISRTKHKEI